MLKKCDMCAYSKCSVKCEVNHKDIVKVEFLMLVTFKSGELAPTGKAGITFDITVCRKLRDKGYIRTNIIVSCGSQQNQGC